MDKKQVVMTLLTALVSGASADMSDKVVEKYVDTAVRLAEELHKKMGE